MNRADSRQLSETVSAAGSMVLFLIFTVCCLVIITVAATAYKRISENYDDTFNSAAAVRYVTNKLRSCDGAEILAENEILLENYGSQTLIYARDGVLYERLFPEGSEVSAEGGEPVFNAENFTVSAAEGLVKISAAGADGREFAAYCRVPGGGAEVEKSD
ncbi:MAG: DUF4860 domain-containing protein [Ruminococcus sp.]|nr:DUF4860 domain-containing protein [Ruminococcus sp.]MCM1381263.1 DUF4860 domain-containing protein [Muribaculaceae bacterium]MCM1478614.1 DUF4860 domain-containing protein [Muribaculaceae bacterium]